MPCSRRLVLAKTFGVRSLNTTPKSSPENNRQPEKDDRNRHERRASDVSEQDEDDRDDGKDCCDVVVHSFPIVGLPRLSCDVIGSKVFEPDRFRVLEWSRGDASDIDGRPERVSFREKAN